VRRSSKLKALSYKLSAFSHQPLALSLKHPMLPYPFVIAGLVPAIHVFLFMDARNKSGHDGVEMAYSCRLTAESFPP